jgi:hypothetical protein
MGQKLDKIYEYNPEADLYGLDLDTDILEFGKRAGNAKKGIEKIMAEAKNSFQNRGFEKVEKEAIRVEVILAELEEWAGKNDKAKIQKMRTDVISEMQELRRTTWVWQQSQIQTVEVATLLVQQTNLIIKYEDLAGRIKELRKKT